MKIINKTFDFLSRLVNTLTGCMLFACNLIFVVNVIWRVVIGRTIRWAEEFICYAFVALIWYMLFILDHIDKQLKIDFIYDRFKEGSLGRKILQVIRGLASLGTGAILTYSGYSVYQQAVRLKSVSVTTGIPYKYVFGTMLVGILIMLVFWLLFPLTQRGKKKMREDEK